MLNAWVINCEDCGGYNDEQLHDLFGTSVNEIIEFYDYYMMNKWKENVEIPLAMYEFFIGINDISTRNRSDIARSVCEETYKRGRWYKSKPVIKFFYIRKNTKGVYTWRYYDCQDIASKSDVPALATELGTGSLNNQPVFISNP